MRIWERLTIAGLGLQNLDLCLALCTAFEQEGPAVTWASSLSTGPFSSQKRPAGGTDGKSQENSYLRKAQT